MDNKLGKTRAHRGYDVAGLKRSGKNGATLGLAAVRRDTKRSVKGKVKRQFDRDGD